MVRKALHERSNSKNNELPQLPMSGRVPQKDEHGPFNVSKPSTPTTMVLARPSTARQDESKPRTPNSIAGSSISFDSLPPVPPLHINKIPPLAVIKDRGTASTTTSRSTRSTVFAQFYQQPNQTSRPSIYVDTVRRKESSNSLRSGTASSSAPLLSPPPTKTPSPRPLPQHPKPILKRTGSYIPPYTPEEYDERRHSWVERTLDQRYNYSRMHGSSLRIVRSEEEEEALDILPEGFPSSSRYPASGSPPLHSLSPGLQDAADRKVIRKKSSFASILSRSDSVKSIQRPGSSRGIPAWARYFYAKGEDPTSDSVPEEGRSSEKIDPSSGIRPLPEVHLSPAPRIEYDPIHFPYDPEDVINRWSYPHLDRSCYPLSPVERIKNRQLFLFCLGFILPFCWMIGALLPLPGPRPVWKVPVVTEDPEEGYRVDVEARLNCTFEQERRFLGHEYWRKINRMMSAVGVLLTAAIIALVVVAVRMA